MNKGKITQKELLIVVGIVIVIAIFGQGFVGKQVRTNEIIGATSIDDPSGARIQSVEESGIASWFGLREGDVVMKINGQAVKGAKSFFSIMTGIENESAVSIVVLRDGVQATVGRGSASSGTVNGILRKQAS